MVLIISIQNDFSTFEVIKWLKYLNVPYWVIYREDIYTLEKLEISKLNKTTIIIKNSKSNIELDLSKVKLVWFRRGDLNFPKVSFNSIKPKDFKSTLIAFLHEEKKVMMEFIYSYLEEKSKINDYRRRSMNKLEVLNKASGLGLNIPNTSIVSRKKYLPKKRNITKPISETMHYCIGVYKFTTYTSEVDQDKVHNNFFYSLVQEKIEKECDLRIYYCFGKFYTMAIMSQSDDQTSIDFRKYIHNNDRANRQFCFKLPIEIEEKLNTLMKYFSLETGSIDMVMSKNGLFYFLEVNPIGQFGMVSYPCNYYLERNLAIEMKSRI